MHDDSPSDPDEPRVNSSPDDLKPWERTKSEPGESMMLFRPRYDTLVNPRSGRAMRRLVLETPDWVNVIARTPEGRLVFVKQFRFGTSAMTFEIPGGMVDPGEDHGVAARRELREETGHSAESWTYLGYVEPNPAFHDNRCHHYLAEGVRPTDAQELDNGEDIAIVLLEEDDVLARIKSGEIAHSLVLTALSRVMDLRHLGPGSA